MKSFSRIAAGLVALVSTVVLVGCERPPVTVKQQGFRGTGMEQVTNPRLAALDAPRHVAPDSLAAAPSDGPKAKDVYQNVKVLGDLSVAEFTRHMAQITQWVAPKEGCAYCHNVANLADDSKYQKVVARRMIQMTQHINVDWQKHVGNTGVTCYTCHRGNSHPEYSWYSAVASNKIFMGGDNGQNKPSPSVGYSTLPYDPLTPYLLKTGDIRVGGTQALPHGNKHGVQDAEGTYALMMHFSKSLGVNCTFCHNAQNFQSWNNNPPQRVTAWHGIQMVRDVNKDYISTLESVFPQDHRGPGGDSAKIACATCHQGANKPLNGKSMVQAHPELAKITAGLTPYAPGQAVAAVMPVAATPAAAVPAGVLGKVVFATSVTALSAEAQSEVKAVAEQMAKFPELKVALSGFADSRGDAVKNQELAKLRAFAVRDGLKANGVAEDRIELRKPEAPVAGGTELDARRVEIISTNK
jgi:photosynthetic reaction center cytochrome c subunit